MTDKNIILSFKIEDILSFKTILDTLTKIVSETSWIVHNSKEAKIFRGLEITTADPSKTAFIRVKMKSDKFPEFECIEKKYQLGINLEKLNKLIKNVDKNDTLNFSVNKKDLQHLIIEIGRKTTNGKKTIKLPLIEMEFEEKSLKSVKFEKIISMTPEIYKSVFRELDDFNNVKIKSTNENILFTFVDDMGTTVDDEYIYDADNGNIELVDYASTDKFEGVYPIKFIILFSKCGNLCEKINIFMKNEYSLTIKYPTPIGDIVVLLSPINEECLKNVEYDYSTDEDDIDVINDNFNKLK